MMTVEEIWREDYPTIGMAETLETVCAQFLDSSIALADRVDCLVVLDRDGKVAGLLNSWMALRALAIHAEHPDQETVDIRMEDRMKLPVSSAMATEIPVCLLGDDLFKVAALLGEHYFECVPVVEGDQYLGVVRTIDLFQRLSEEIIGRFSGGVFSQG